MIAGRHGTAVASHPEMHVQLLAAGIVALCCSAGCAEAPLIFGPSGPPPNEPTTRIHLGTTNPDVTLEQRVRLASAAAALKAMRHGAQAGCPTWQEVSAMMDNYQ